MRKEIKEIIGKKEIEVEEGVFLKIQDTMLGSELTELADKILLLIPKDKDNGEKVERLQQAKKKFYGRKTSHFKGDDADLHREARDVFCQNILSILNEKEEVFDVKPTIEELQKRIKELEEENQDLQAIRQQYT